MNVLTRTLLFAAGGALVGGLLAAAMSTTTSAAPSRDTTAQLVDIGDNGVVAGTADASGAWLLVRDRTADAALHLLGVNAAGTVTPTPLQLRDAGTQGAVLVAPDGSIWVGAGAQLARFDSATATVKAFALPVASHPARMAQRAPDGSVLGLGNITSLAADRTGAIWIARFGDAALTRFEPRTGQSESRTLPDEDSDPSELAVSGDTLWFTVNYGANGQLAARTGRLDLLLGAATYLNRPAIHVAVRTDGVHLIERDWTRLNDIGAIVQQRTSLSGVDLHSTGIDTKGNLVARVNRQNRLQIIGPTGAVLRNVDFEAGTFTGRDGKRYTTVAPLAFIASMPDGMTWFAPMGGQLYRFN